jgi:chromosome partitioning protein
MIISFTSSKGGVGKSTACAAIACELARQGGRVLIYDLDRNRTLESWCNRAKPQGITVQAVNPADFKAIFAGRPRQNVDHILVDVAGIMDAGILQAF